MISKLNVKLDTLRPELALLEPIVDEVFAYLHRTAVVTSTNDGKHKVNSLHYKNAAFDLRVNFFNSVPQQWECWKLLNDAIQAKYPGYYDVIMEYAGEPRAHIHVEASPLLCKTMFYD